MNRRFTIRRFLILFFGALGAAGCVFYAAFYVMSTGAAFAEFNNWSMHSKNMTAAVGEVQRSELIWLGHSFSEKVNGENGRASFCARVTGTNGSAIVDVVMTKENDLWKIKEASISGRHLEDH